MWNAQSILDLAEARLRNPQDLTPNTTHDLTEIMRPTKAMIPVESAARAVYSHWAEFGPEYGLDEIMDRLRKALGDP